MSGFFLDGQFWDISTDDAVEIKDAAERLDKIGISGALKEARLLWVAAHTDHIKAFQNLIERRVAREPLSHLIGHRDFYDLRFAISSDALDPRPETEVLVNEALQMPFERVLDLGTGSGCILLSLLHVNASATGVGADMSSFALDVARSNAKRHNLETRVTFKESDWFQSVDGTFDLIVSNPPYIAIDEMDDLQPEVRLHEPRMALTDEGDGLSCYRKIIGDYDPYLRSGGRLMVEIGPTQANAVSDMMIIVGLKNIRVVQDLDKRDRVVIGHKAHNLA